MNNYTINGKHIIGVDHGYGNMKTANCVFKTGIEEVNSEPVVSDNFIRYKGRYYVIGETHLTYQGNKTDTPEFYILTLAALAKEMKKRNMRSGNIILACGLPLAWVKSQYKDFKAYLLQNRQIDFEYQRKSYHIHIDSVEIFQQSFAPIFTMGKLPGMNMLCDIGNGTMNIMQINNGMPLEKSVATERFGVSICTREILNELTKQYAESLPEELIEPMLINGIGENPSKNALVVRNIASKYTGEIIKKLYDYGYKEDLVNLYILGGGGCLLKNFSDFANKPGVTFIDDICANAKAYEQMAYQKLMLKRSA